MGKTKQKGNAVMRKITELKEKQERKEEKAHSGKSGKSGTTHNKSQKNDEVMAQNADRKRAEDTRDKPWH